MARTNAQRQAAYRQRHLKDMDGALERLNMMVSLDAKRRLERLATCYDVTQRSLLERLLAEAEHALLATLPAKAQDDSYEGRPISLRRNESTRDQAEPSSPPEAAPSAIDETGLTVLTAEGSR